MSVKAKSRRSDFNYFRHKYTWFLGKKRQREGNETTDGVPRRNVLSILLIFLLIIGRVIIVQTPSRVSLSAIDLDPGDLAVSFDHHRCECQEKGKKRDEIEHPT
jgi:hypothetical protein